MNSPRIIPKAFQCCYHLLRHISWARDSDVRVFYVNGGIFGADDAGSDTFEPGDTYLLNETKCEQRLFLTFVEEWRQHGMGHERSQSRRSGAKSE